MDNTIHSAATRGDPDAVRRFLAEDVKLATLKGGQEGWDPLTYLCFSELLRKDRSRAADFIDVARVLLDAGASANTGFYVNDEFESVLYGAAGVAHNAELTRLLLERGADPNDGEVTYHTPETFDNAALQALVETGRLTEDSFATMLLRKCDWHDYDGVALLLERGADPNRLTQWGYTALHQAIRRDNDIATVSLLLDHGADPAVLAHGQSAAARAAWEGRGDVLNLLHRRGLSTELHGVDRLVAACATNDSATVGSLASEPRFVREIVEQEGALLGEFAGIGNTDGVRHLLDLGADVRATVVVSDGYWGIARNSMALHVAAWRARHATLRLLIERGAPVDVRDGNGRTPLMLAIRACVDSYWKEGRSPESVEALLAAGASTDGLELPTGYAAIDTVLVDRSSRRDPDGRIVYPGHVGYYVFITRYLEDDMISAIEGPTSADQILTLERGALDRWGKGDPGGFLESYAADITYFDPSTATRIDGHQAMVSRYLPWVGKIQIARYDMLNPHVVVDGNMALLTYNLVNYIRNAQGGESVESLWNSTTVYQRRDSTWKAIHSHWSFTLHPALQNMPEAEEFEA